MHSKRKLLFVGSLFLFIGIVFVIVGIVVMNQGDNLKKRCTEETTGTVVEVICQRDSNTDMTETSYTYYPVIEYQVGERTISVKSRSGQNPPKYQVGDKVEICYNPNNVEEYIIKGDSTPKLLGIAAIVLGSLAALVGIIVLIRNVILFVAIRKVVKDDTSDTSDFPRKIDL